MTANPWNPEKRHSVKGFLVFSLPLHLPWVSHGMAEEADSVLRNPESAASCHSEASLGLAAGTQLSAQLAESKDPR